MRAGGILIVSAVLVFTGVACGGDDDDGGDALSKEDYLEQADAICAEYNEELEALFEANADLDAEDPEAVSAFANDELLPLFRDMIDQVDDLNPPEADAELIDEIMADTDEALDELEAQLEEDPVAAMQSEDDPFAGIDERMREYGFTECAS